MIPNHNSLKQYAFIKFSVSVGLESGPCLSKSSASGSHEAVIKVSARAKVPSQDMTGKDSLPTSLTGLLAEYSALLAVGQRLPQFLAMLAFPS